MVLKKDVTFMGDTICARGVDDRAGCAVLLDALYDGKSEQYIETQVKFEDGRTGKVNATLRLMDAKTFAAMKQAA